MNDDKPTQITRSDIDKVFERLMNGDYDRKPTTCWTCGKEHFSTYGECFNECDECFFSRFSKDQVEEFYRSFF